MMAENIDTLQVYLTELSRVMYEGTEETQEMQEYADKLGAASYDAFKKRYTGVLQALVSVDMDFNQLSAYLASQKNKRQNPMSEIEAKSIENFWKTNKSRIHDVVVSNSQWGTKLKSVSWRVDVKSRSKTVDQMTDPVGIVQLKLVKSDSLSDEKSVEFEVGEALGTDLVEKLSQIEKQIKAYVEGK